MKHGITSLVLGVLWLLLPAMGHALSFTVGSATVSNGATFTIPVSITGAVNFESFEFSLNFDPTILEANIVGATAGAFLPGDWFVTSPGIVDNTAGQILGVSAFGSAVSGGGVLATIEFTVLSSGLSSLTASNVFLNLQDSTSGGFTVGNGSVTGGGTPVPEPSSFVLLLLGGLTFWGLRRWRGHIVARN